MAAFSFSAKPGDLIEIFRDAYQHWAIYIGGDEVVHLTTSRTNTGSDSNAFGSLLMVLDSTKAYVRRQMLWEVVGCDRFHVNNLLDKEYEPRRRHVIVREACRMVGKEMPYSVTSCNCEHFVTELRYGKPESRQVQRAAMIGRAAIASVGILGLIAAAATAFMRTDDDDDGDSSD